MGNYSWRNDPVSFDRYPQFFIAHELAHQFWGDAVGGENYHEQWISEGFAQYFALLYAERTRSKDTFEDILRQLRRTSIAYDRYGPVWLGYRLGHLQGDSRIFRALVYNKGALVLHMLRRLVGDDAFFRGIRRFYHDSRFKKVGTDDVRKAFEAESGQSLERFFERWILLSGIPQVTVNYAIEDVDAARKTGPPLSSSSMNPSLLAQQNLQPHAVSPTAGTSVLRVRIEQKGDVYDFPITVRLRYASGEQVDVIVPVTDRIVERTLPLKGRLDGVNINADDGALVEVSRK
jgi:aminopeptidase N